MVIKRKNIRPSGLLEVEADNTDTVDVGGFSDPIQTVGAKTAKFSGGATMQANSGLRIGMTQLKINTGDVVFIPRTRIVNSGDASNTGNIIDDNPATSGAFDENEFVVIDFTTIATAELHVTLRLQNALDLLSLRVEISDDNISYTTIATLVNPSTTTTDINLGINTWRYVRLTAINGDGLIFVFELFELIDPSTSDVTVKVRSSVTLDTADGTILITDQVMNENESLTFDTDLLLTENPTGDFVTLEIVSQTGNIIPVTLSEITSIKEV